jgi:predicted nucleic acid-binding protein
MSMPTPRKQSIYLDMCCYNRPFDSQLQTRVRMETEAKLHLQAKAIDGSLALIWSYVLAYENSFNPQTSRRESIANWAEIATTHIAGNEAITAVALELSRNHGLKSFDALHVACATIAGAHLFVTTDDFILRKMKSATALHVVSPIDALSILENWYEN